ncbi:MAG: HAMP domain-containing histidine kinase [Nitrospirae bacterium]|nr:HAMP domain-containing histidine kinase [Nitrospirota bacterium]
MSGMLVSQAAISLENARLYDELYRKSEEIGELNKNLAFRVSAEVERSRGKDLALFENSRRRALSDLLMNIAHHWRQPLEIVGILVQNIQDDYVYGQLDQEGLHRSVFMIMDELSKLSGTISSFDNIYDNNKETTGFTLSSAVVESLSLLESELKGNNIKVKSEISGDGIIRGVPGNLSQALIKIITNSIDNFKERKTSDKTIAISLKKDDPSGIIALTISDNGGGIDEDIIDKIFDPYFTSNFKVKDKGLGLYIVKNVIEEEFHGRLTVKNNEEGAEFTIWI